MSGWSATATLPKRRVGASWKPTDTADRRVTGPGWFTTHVERVATLSATGTFTTTIQVKYPNKGHAFSGNGGFSATIKPRYALTAAFGGSGVSYVNAGQVKYITATFGGGGDMGQVINDGFMAIITGGATFLGDGLTAVVEYGLGSLPDGFSATVKAAAAGAAPFSATGNLQATATAKVEGSAAFSASGQLQATVSAASVGTQAVAANFSGGGNLTATGIGYQMAEGMLTATVTKVTSQPVTAGFTGSGLLTGTLFAKLPVTAPLSGDGALTATVTAATSTVPVYNSVGAGHGRNSTTIFWTHTIPVGTKMLVVFSSGGAGAAGANHTAVCGSTPMTQYAKVADYANYISEYAFVLFNPPTGAQTITVTSSVSNALAGNSTAYDNVGSLGTAITKRNTANATALSLSAPSATGQVVVQAFATGASTGLTAYNQTQRWIKNYASGSNYGIVAGEAPGDPALNFTATSGSNLPYGAIAIPLDVAPIVITDNFNRADSATDLGANWTNRLNSVGISGNVAYPVIGGAGWCIATHNTPIASSDDMEVSAIVGGSNENRLLGLGFSATGDGMFVYSDGTYYQLYHQTDWTSWSLVVSSGALTQNIGDKITIRRVGEVYSVLQNTVERLSWTHTGGVLTRDSSHRLAHIGLIDNARWDSFEARAL